MEHDFVFSFFHKTKGVEGFFPQNESGGGGKIRVFFQKTKGVEEGGRVSHARQYKPIFLLT